MPPVLKQLRSLRKTGLSPIAFSLSALLHRLLCKYRSLHSHATLPPPHPRHSSQRTEQELLWLWRVVAYDAFCTKTEATPRWICTNWAVPSLPTPTTPSLWLVTSPARESSEPVYHPRRMGMSILHSYLSLPCSVPSPLLEGFCIVFGSPPYHPPEGTIRAQEKNIFPKLPDDARFPKT